MVNVPSPNRNETVQPNMFIRKGKIGGWKEIFTKELEEKFDAWIEENMKDTDLKFPIDFVQKK